MFYTELINYLRSDTKIAATVTTYNGNPAIFGDEAPEDAVLPYITTRIETRKLPDSVIMAGDVYIDYYDYNKSRVTADNCGEYVENRLDLIMLRTERLTDLRFSLGSSGYVEESDPRTIHFNSHFSVRGARAKWMRETR